MSRLGRIAAVIACVLALFGCSSSDDSSSSSATTTGSGGGDASGFVTELSDACSTGQEALSSATTEFGTALDELRSATNREEFQAAAADVESSAQAIVDALGEFKSSIEALDVPDDLSDALDSLTQSLEDQVDVANQLADAPTDSVASYEAVLTDVQSDAEAARQAQTDAADALGASTCAPPAASGGGGGGGGGNGGGGSNGGATTTTAA